MFYIHCSVLSEIALNCELQGWKTKCATEKQERIFPLGFTTEHLEVISEAERPVRQAGALLVGWDKLEVPVSLWSLSVCTSLSLFFILSFSFFIFLICHCDRIDSSQLVDTNKFIMKMADEQIELDQKKEGKVFMAVHLSIISLWSSCFPEESEGIGVCLRVHVQVL